MNKYNNLEFEKFAPQIKKINAIFADLALMNVEVYKAAIRAVLCSHSKFILPSFSVSGLPVNRILDTYGMMHLPFDTKAQGLPHRDGTGINNIMWVPVTIAGYDRLSVISFTEKNYFLSNVGLLLSKFNPLYTMLSKKIALDSSIYVWNERMIHRGELNISEKISIQLQVIFNENDKSDFYKGLVDYSYMDMLFIRNQISIRETVKIPKISKYPLFFSKFKKFLDIAGIGVEYSN